MKQFIMPTYELPLEGTTEFRARVLGWNGEYLTPSDIATVTYKLFEISPIRHELTELEGYQEETLAAADVLYTTLQDWDQDTIGFNFRHVPPNRSVIPFARSGKVYRLQYYLTPTSSTQQIIVVPLEIHVR